MKKEDQRLIIKVVSGVVFMFGFCYLLVPLYSLVCKQAGINGKSALRDSDSIHSNIDLSRMVTIEFTTTLHGNLAFQFKPMTTKLNVHPGETKTIDFYAENDTGHAITVQAIPSIAPGIAAKYLKKTQCFCFTQQFFNQKEKVLMPVIFHIDPELPKSVNFLTLNYTLFDANHFIKKQKHFTQGRIEIR